MEIHNSSQKSDPFWFIDPSILLNPNRLSEFYPNQNLTKDEKLNSLARFSIYIGILLTLIYVNVNYLIIPLIGLCLTYWVFKRKTNVENFEISDIPVKVDKSGQLCKLPTKNNPFMNILPTDYNNQPNLPPACLQSDRDVSQKTEQNFGNNLYKDVEDLWDRRNSQRQYVTLPITTIPNDRESFMKWCWGTTNVTKNNDFK